MKADKKSQSKDGNIPAGFSLSLSLWSCSALVTRVLSDPITSGQLWVQVWTYSAGIEIQPLWFGLCGAKFIYQPTISCLLNWCALQAEAVRNHKPTMAYYCSIALEICVCVKHFGELVYLEQVKEYTQCVPFWFLSPFNIWVPMYRKTIPASCQSGPTLWFTVSFMS